MKTIIAASVLALSLAGPSAAQGLLRQHIDNALNRAEAVLGNDNPELEARRLTDLVELRDTEIDRMIQILAQKAEERRQAAAQLLDMGVTPPEPRVLVPAPAGPGEEATERCFTTLAGVPLACW